MYCNFNRIAGLGWESGWLWFFSNDGLGERVSSYAHFCLNRLNNISKFFQSKDVEIKFIVFSWRIIRLEIVQYYQLFTVLSNSEGFQPCILGSATIWPLESVLWIVSWLKSLRRPKTYQNRITKDLHKVALAGMDLRIVEINNDTIQSFRGFSRWIYPAWF